MSKYVVKGKKALETQANGMFTITLPTYTRSRHYMENWVIDKICDSASFEMVLCPTGVLKKHVKYVLVDSENDKNKKEKSTCQTRDFDLQINKPFLMSNTPITQGVWEYVMNYNDSYHQDVSLNLHIYEDEEKIIPVKIEKDLNRPVEQITWYDAILFCNKLSELQGLEPFYKMSKIEYDENLNPDRLGNQGRQPLIQASELHIVYAVVDTNENANGYRLPTQIEWEYAFFADGKGRIGGYDGLLQDVAWTSYAEKDVNAPFFNQDTDHLFENSCVNFHQKIHSLFHTYPVKNKKPNSWGLYDMIGNVEEWVFDTYLRQACTIENIQKQPLSVLLGLSNTQKKIKITKEKLDLLIASIDSLKSYVIKPTRKFTRKYTHIRKMMGESFNCQRAPTLDVLVTGSFMSAHRALPNIGFRIVRNLNQ